MPHSIGRFQKIMLKLPREHSTTGVRLLHGLSESPYSRRHLGESFHAAGATAMGLRLLCHGTTPAGLVEVKLQDWAAAVHLTANPLREVVASAATSAFTHRPALSAEEPIDPLSSEADV